MQKKLLASLIVTTFLSMTYVKLQANESPANPPVKSTEKATENTPTVKSTTPDQTTTENTPVKSAETTTTKPITKKELNIKITSEINTVEVTHQGKKVKIQRIQDPNNVIPNTYNKTSRACPPFCIQPAKIAPKVETIAELEVLDYLKRMSTGDESILVIDSRTPEWMARGSIPGAVNIPWTKINIDQIQAWEEGQESEEVDNILQTKFGVKKTATGFNYAYAKTLILFCNGAWCPQSSVNIKTLIKKGYPAERIKWYRGGMQAWTSLGLTVTTPK